MDIPTYSTEAPGVGAEDAVCASSMGCQSVAMSSTYNSDVRWNMVGNPLSSRSERLSNDLRVQTKRGPCSDFGGCSIEDAKTNDVMHNTFFKYDGLAYVDLQQGSTLNAWDAYWVAELPHSEANRTQLWFPK